MVTGHHPAFICLKPRTVNINGWQLIPIEHMNPDGMLSLRHKHALLRIVVGIPVQIHGNALCSRAVYFYVSILFQIKFFFKSHIMIEALYTPVGNDHRTSFRPGRRHFQPQKKFKISRIPYPLCHILKLPFHSAVFCREYGHYYNNEMNFNKWLFSRIALIHRFQTTIAWPFTPFFLDNCKLFCYNREYQQEVYL